ncbi:FKBP-type peptidyl-prolyl cis-trans isomerase [Agromyces sp. LHK192]|uniref:FKBP-type peptidyl-prolyl cis-trans isomerase n=1 Tax=Agromyces sp. LHK192 TaxID=2498704 RepID=UPI000FD9DE6F|nr:FKBP-type peptidyl-prolyl cis-trans isomerase [Agromyces sp. LHK192]
MNRAMRRGAPIALAVTSALVLAGCASSPEGAEPTATEAATAECQDLSSGDLSDGVQVEGEFGTAAPVATFTTPVETDELQRTILIEGDGETTAPGDVVDVVISMYSSVTGEQLVSQPAQLGVGDEATLPGFTAAIDCVPIGTRTVTVAPAADVYGEQGNETIGVGPNEAVVIVADVTGEVQPLTPAEWTENVPEITFNDDAAPTVVIPDAPASTELELAVLEEGDGAEVQAGDTVTLNYEGIDWDTKETFDSSYERGEPASFSTDGVIQGFGAALVGQKVGTKLVVTIPPEYGYGTDPAAHELGGKTLVFVVEILDTASAG